MAASWNRSATHTRRRATTEGCPTGVGGPRGNAKGHRDGGPLEQTGKRQVSYFSSWKRVPYITPRPES